MEIQREVHVSVMKGLGPEMVNKIISVYFDDIEEGTSQSEIEDMILWEVKSQLKKAGFEKYVIKEIHNS